MFKCLNQSRPVKACRPFCFSQKENLTEKHVKGGEWTKWVILNIDIRPQVVEFAKLT